MPKTATRAKLLAAARDLLVSGTDAPPSAAAIAARAGVSRLTVYHHFGSQGGLLAALAAETGKRPVDRGAAGSPAEPLRRLVEDACARWASDPALFRRLPPAAEMAQPEGLHVLASSLAEADRLRPGCSLREAEDVLALLTSFRAFDALHGDGRRSPAAVAEILLRMCASILAPA